MEKELRPAHVWLFTPVTALSAKRKTNRPLTSVFLLLEKLTGNTGIGVHILAGQRARLKTRCFTAIGKRRIVGDEEMDAGKTVDILLFLLVACVLG
jgi:hypothetical protein